ncbi:hypothetical protein llap_21664 [Limosa lapponica baueri]|uniref:Uncharacterized protein n=1 Tax=Limosa lapponica baueri TaxID=1758121 RepID=A0A2I0T2N1_LIMLA|nr:hypothetical protein llap_21664 [Limosa lapponica baueri]
MLDNPFSEEIFPNIQPEPPLAQVEAISSCPIACDLDKLKDVQPHLCEYLDVCLVPQQEVFRLPAQQSAYLESKEIKRHAVEHPGSAREDTSSVASYSVL